MAASCLHPQAHANTHTGRAHPSTLFPPQPLLHCPASSPSASDLHIVSCLNCPSFFLIVKNTLFTYGCFCVCVCRYLKCAEVRRGAGFLGTGVTNDGALCVRCWELTPRPSKRAASALDPELSLQPRNCLCWNQWPREKVSMASIPGAPNTQQCRQQQVPHKSLGDHLIPDILGELYLG